MANLAISSIRSNGRDWFDRPFWRAIPADCYRFATQTLLVSKALLPERCPAPWIPFFRPIRQANYLPL